ncbi:MAG: alkaline phosphatase family protein [Prolixibacteraceae bacterium]
MKKICSLLILIGIIPLISNAQDSRSGSSHTPKLVVGITIENMRIDYIDRFWNTFSNGGFKRLVDDGAVFYNVRADIHNIKPSTMLPTIYTGTYPSEHGIVADKWYTQLTEKEGRAVADGYYLTLGSDSHEGNVSANQLKVPTLGDALKLQTNGKSKVFSVALNAQSAVLSAGHSADGAFWYDKTNGNMITSSYYMEQFPNWIMEYNNMHLAQNYLSRTWDLMLPKTSYKAGYEDDYVLEDGFWKKWNTFPYNLKKISESQEFPNEFLKVTPFGNKLISDFSIQLIDQEQLGMDDYPDLLNITFSTLDYANKWFNPSSMEIQETYVRTNLEIANILNYLDKILGKDNYLIFLSAASTSAYPVKIQKEEYNLNAGEFSPQSAMALLRLYLNAVYGVGDWIEMYNEEQVYLNHNYIEKKEKSLNEMRQSVASFLNQFTGIKAAVPANVIESGNLNNPRFQILENSYCVQRSGDVMLLLEEGWFPVHKYNEIDYSTENRIPLLFYGLSVNKGKFYGQAEVVDIIPTVCRSLKIVPPDDAKGKCLEQIF